MRGAVEPAVLPLPPTTLMRQQPLTDLVHGLLSVCVCRCRSARQQCRQYLAVLRHVIYMAALLRTTYLHQIVTSAQRLQRSHRDTTSSRSLRPFLNSHIGVNGWLPLRSPGPTMPKKSLFAVMFRHAHLWMPRIQQSSTNQNTKATIS